MAPPTRSIRIKFDGSAKGLIRAAQQAADQIDKVDRKVKRAAVASVGAGMFSGVGDALRALPAQLKGTAIVAAVGLGLVMSPAIAGAITAGVLLAVGGGVLAAGIAAAAKDPKVAAAWSQFGERAKKAFAGFAEPFKGPLIRAADTFAGALERMAPTIKEMGRDFAPIIDKLAPALAKMAEKMLPGIRKALEASKPLFDKIAEHMPRLGDAVSKFFENISKGGDGATRFLDVFFTNLEFWLPKIGSFLAWLAEKFVDITDAIAGMTEDGLRYLGTFINGAARAFGWVPELGPKLRTAAADFNQFRDSVNASLAQIRDKRVTVEVHFKMFGKPGTNIGGIDGSGFKGLAAGGPAVAGRTYLVGERGPELLTMGSQSGQIIPNHQLGGVGGAPEVRVFIGERELTDIVRVEVRERDRGLKRRALAGAR